MVDTLPTCARVGTAPTTGRAESCTGRGKPGTPFFPDARRTSMCRVLPCGCYGGQECAACSPWGPWAEREADLSERIEAEAEALAVMEGAR